MHFIHFYGKNSTAYIPISCSRAILTTTAAAHGRWHHVTFIYFLPILSHPCASFHLFFFFAFLKRFFKSLLIRWEHCTYTTSVNKKAEAFSLWAQRWILDPSGSSNTRRSRSRWAVALGHVPPSRAPLHLLRLSLWSGDSHAFASSIDPSTNLPATTCSWPLLDFFLSPACLSV